MSIFKPKIEYVSAVCPECKGHLELDSNLETAFCQYCGAQCIVKNAPHKRKYENKLKLVLDFVERQQALIRKDRQEKQRKIKETEEKQSVHFKKYWWIYLLAVILYFAFVTTMMILENQGII